MKKCLLQILAGALTLLLLLVPATVFAEGESGSDETTAPPAEPPTEDVPSYEQSIEIDGAVGTGNGFRGGIEEGGRTALIAGTSTPDNKAINGSWAVINSETSKLCLSFTMERLTEACPRFTIRIRDNTRVYHTPILTVGTGGELHILGINANLVGILGDNPVDLYLEMDVKWASETGATDGHLQIHAYVNGVYRGYYERVLQIADPTSSIQMLAQANENPHVNETNGVYLYDGVPKATEGEIPTEEKTVIGPNDLEGWYAICKISNMHAYSASVRRGFSYAGAELYPTGNVLTTGLRFSFGLDRAWFDSIPGEKKIGAIILPTDLLGGGRFTPELLDTLTAGKDYATTDGDVGLLPIGEEDGAYRFMASLVKLNTHSFARAFTAVGYVETESGMRYYTGAESYSAHEAALDLLASEESLSEEMRMLTFDALARTPMLETGEDGTLRIAEIEGYESPYALMPTIDGLGFELIATDVTVVGAIIIDGRIYTSGWLPVSVGDAILTVPVYAPSDTKN